MFKNFPFRMFYNADDGAGSGGATPPEGSTNNNDDGAGDNDSIQSKLTALEQMAKQHQSDADRLRTEKKKLNDELEAIKLEKMNAEQKREYEIQKREQELNELKDRVMKSEVKVLKADIMAEMSIPSDYAPVITGANEVEIRQACDVVKLMIEKEREQAKIAFLQQSGRDPQSGGGDAGGKGQITKEQFKKMSPEQIADAIDKGELNQIMGW